MSKRLRLAIRGAVQGVGFRPFIYRLATELALNGWVNNSAQGVFVEVEGAEPTLQKFLLRLETEKPPRSSIQSLESSWLDPVGFKSFEIRESETGGPKTALVLPDIATCPDCLREIFDPANRRYFYPFTNCTNCGPRFSIIEALPYDRANTSMKKFTMCPQCQAEYDNPLDRRFHAQPNACPICGPHLELWDEKGRPIPSAIDGPNPGRAVLTAAADALQSGKIIAVKGLGGFHLMADARNDDAVRTLRERKHREEKPFALMFQNLEAIRSACEVSPAEERLLRSPESPIVLLRRIPDSIRNTQYAIRNTCPEQVLDPHQSTNPSIHQSIPLVSRFIAPRNPYLGAMLPYTPLHHLLLSMLGFPVVATSGNVSDEPICIDEREAVERLAGIADLFLIHNRPIVRHVDDSIVRLMAGREMLVRRARGYAPLPISVSTLARNPRGNSAEDTPKSPSVPDLGLWTLDFGLSPILAVGAHLKNTVALAVGGQAFISQHIGDLETDQSYEAFRRVIHDFQRLYEAQPVLVAADAHPDYLSTKLAHELTSAPNKSGEPLPRLQLVQHHVAHVLSCMAENEVEPPAFGVSWDGTGYGLDGSIWGGEFFLITRDSVERVAHLRPFRLPGGDQAVKEPRRAALGLLYEVFGEAAFERTDVVARFTPAELSTLKAMLTRKLNSPLTSSIGRLFDAISALAGLRNHVRFEGQAAMELEFALDDIETDEAYSFAIVAPAAVHASQSVSIALPLPLRGGEGRGEGVPGHGRVPPAVKPALILDWAPLVHAVLSDTAAFGVPGSAGAVFGVPALAGSAAPPPEGGTPTLNPSQNAIPSLISAKFHNALVESIISVARLIGQDRVVLSGGCFQNRYLTEQAIKRLTQAGFRPYWHQRVPPNDGGISLGQLVAAFRNAPDLATRFP